MAKAEQVRKAIDPITDGSGGWTASMLSYGMRFADYGSYGLRQFGGWVREEFLPELAGRQAARSHDLLLFPSLHDSGGFVVLKALCHGMPVVCLDLAGPKEIVTPESGLIIKTDGRNTTQIASSIANELYNVLDSPTNLTQLSSGAISRASEFILPNRVARFYQEALRFIEGRRNFCSAPSVARFRAETPVAPFPADGE